MSDTIPIHVAGIEWSDDSMDPYLTAGRELVAVKADLRRVIEGQYDDDWDPEEDDAVHAYVRDHRDVVDWDEWHDGLHEIDGTPWVTFAEVRV